MPYDPSQLFTPYYQNIQSGLAGELPQDVVNQIKQRSAEFGVATGMPGSQFAGYQGLCNLGLTSLDQQRWAANQFQPNVRSALDYGTWLDKFNVEREEAERQRQLALQQQQELAAMQAWRNKGPFTPPIVSQGGTPMQPQMPRQSVSRGGLNTNQMLSGLIGKYGNYGTSAPMGAYDSMAPMGGNILGSTSNIYMSPDTITEELYGIGGLPPGAIPTEEQFRNRDALDEQIAREWGYGGLPPESISGTASNDYAGNWGNEAADYWYLEG